MKVDTKHMTIDNNTVQILNTFLDLLPYSSSKSDISKVKFIDNARVIQEIMDNRITALNIVVSLNSTINGLLIFDLFIKYK